MRVGGGGGQGGREYWGKMETTVLEQQYKQGKNKERERKLSVSGVNFLMCWKFLYWFS